MSRWNRSIRNVRQSVLCIGQQWSQTCLELTQRKPSWPAVMCDRSLKAGHMIASDRLKHCHRVLQDGDRSLIASPLSIASCCLLLPCRGHGSLRGRNGPPQHLVRSTGAAMSTTGSHGVFMWPKALLRSRLHPRPVGQLSHPRRRFRWI
jgi:hypothetical protein